MKIIKSKFFRPRKCEYGDFEIVPDEGWELSQSFIDFESGLLIVSVNDRDETKWTSLGGYMRTIPTKHYIINLETINILSPSEWKKYFNYDKTTFETTDKKYKLTTQRIHDPENNTDSIHEELENLETGHISKTEMSAFRQEKRENLLESSNRYLREAEEKKRILEAKPNLEEFYLNELDKLKDTATIIGYIDNTNTYKLVFSSSNFILFKCNEIPTEYGQWKTMEFVQIEEYSNLEEFWEDFSRDEKWFLKLRVHYGISEKPLVLAKLIISYFNNLRKGHRFTYEEYSLLNEWENIVWSEEYKETEHKQWCINCYKKVRYYPRYPKHICRDCASKDKFDKDGNLVDEDRDEFECVIDGKEYFAQEARFGGTVIQRKE